MGFRLKQMMYSTAHIVQSSALVYSRAKSSNNYRSIQISVYSICRTICISAFKHFVCSFTNMFTGITSLRSITRVNNDQLNTVKQRLIFKFCSQICERPSTKFSFKLLRTSFARKSNISQIFNRDTFALLFSSKYNRFCDCVIDYTGVSSLPSRKPFQKPFTASCAFGLNRTTNFLAFFPILVKSVIGMFNAIICFNDGCDTKINSCKFRNIFNSSIWNIDTLKQKELTFSVNKVCFPFDVRNIFFIKTSERYFLPTTYTPYRSNFFLVGKNPTIISNCTKWLKNTFGFSIKLISVIDFSNSSYNYLCRKISGVFNIVVNKFVNFELIKNFILPSNRGNIIASLVNRFNGFKKQFFLFLGRVKFYFQRQNHIANILIFNLKFLYLKKLFNINLGVSYFPHTHSKADECVSVAVL